MNIYPPSRDKSGGRCGAVHPIGAVPGGIEASGFGEVV